MNCHEFTNLLPKEKTEYIGSLIHACQSDSKLYEMGLRIIKQATKKGLFEGVSIHPPDWDNVPIEKDEE